MMTLTRPWLIIPGLDCDEHSYHVIEGRQVLGRSPWCDFRLNHPTVSSRHAELLLCGESLSVRDLGSRNGTYLDDMRIERATLDVGQSLRLGLVILQVADCPLPDDQPGSAVLPPKHPGTLEQKAKDLTRVLFEMRWNNPKHRKLLEVEGHRQWLPGRDGGYAQLVAALDDQRGW